jgi:hypothetical protein
MNEAPGLGRGEVMNSMATKKKAAKKPKKK